MQTVFITGGHKGLGLESVKRIASTGRYDLVLGGRNLAELQPVVDSLQQQYNIKARALHLDTASLQSVRVAASEFKRMVATGDIGPLQSLMLNAGAQFLGPVSFSLDNYEMTFATNALGNFLLFNLLLDEISAGGRVVVTASGTHDPDTIDGKMVGKAIAADAFALANQGKQGKPISGGKRYSTSKLGAILYAYELDRRLKRSGVNIASIAFDPGLIVETGLARTAPGAVQALMRTSMMKRFFKALGVTMGSLAFSGASLADIAIDKKFADASGSYLQSNNGKLAKARSSKASYDEAIAKKFWSDTEALVGLTEAERPKRLTT